MDKVTIEINENENYNIEKVSVLTGYCTAYIRGLERKGKIPQSFRDEKNWRYWKGKDVKKICEYRGNQQSPLAKARKDKK